MSRLSHLKKFYTLMKALERNIGSKRKLGNTHGRMYWPQQGVYFFFEKGESRKRSGNGERVVRVGTHALNPRENTTLWRRIRSHRGTMAQPGTAQRNSVFRKWAGNSLCRTHFVDDCPPWPQLRHELSHEEQMDVESWINDHMLPMNHLFLPVDDREDRAYIERKAIGLLSEYGEDKKIDPAPRRWLGRYCDSERVRKSGLWQSDYVDDLYDSRDSNFLNVFSDYVDEADDHP